MKGPERLISIFMVLLMVVSTMAIVGFSDDMQEVEASSRGPTRGLYQLSETYNISFNKPTFYTDTDPNYAANKLDNNTWDDIAIVVMIQDKHKTLVRENNDPAGAQVSCADIYQAAFVPVNKTDVDTGTQQRVMIEDFTATTCGYCTSVIGSMNRLDLDDDYFPDKYIGIQWHVGGTYGTGTPQTSATSRRGYYNFGGGIPRYIVDGMIPYVGGSTSPNSSSMDTRFKNDIATRGASASPISIEAFGGHSSTKAWVNFTITIEDSSFDNALVDAQIALVQDAYPRRHGINTAYLGWIGQDLKTQRVFDIDGEVPVITVNSPSDNDVLSGTETISWVVTDADAADSHIRVDVEYRPVGGEWESLAGGKGAADSKDWNTAVKTAGEYDTPDGDYEIRISALDYWEDTASKVIPVSILNPDAPEFLFNNDMMVNNIDGEDVEGLLDIVWMADDDEDGDEVSIDLFYSRVGDGVYTTIAEDLENTGIYAWDTMDPRVPDNTKYLLKAVATDLDETSTEAVTTFTFSINNPDPPVAELLKPAEGEEVSGLTTIRWAISDPEVQYTDIKVALSLSDNGGETYDIPLITGTYNNVAQSYSLDTTAYEDGSDYKLWLVAEDPTALTAEAFSETFSIYNNDEPYGTIRTPAEEDEVGGDMEITWSSGDEEDGSDDLLVKLEYKLAGSYWHNLLDNEPNTGSFMLDTTILDDGFYSIKLILTDTREATSAESLIDFTVYNPDAPIISDQQGPSGEIRGYASFSWSANDPDPYEDELLMVWIYIAPTGSEFELVEGGIPNTNSYRMDMTEMEDGEYNVKIEVYDRTEANLSAFHIFENLIVNNPDAPTVDFLSTPTAGSNNTEDLIISWEGSDLDDDQITYKLMYSLDGGGWKLVPSASGLVDTTFVWNTSGMETGDYRLKVIATESTTSGLTDEKETDAFHIYVPPADDGGDPTGGEPTEPSGSTDDNGNSALIIVVLLVLLLLIAVMGLLGILVIKKRREAAAVPPGGFMPPPGLPPQQMQQLPGAVAGGELPPGPQEQNQLPPAQLEAPPVQTEAPPMLQEEVIPENTVPEDQGEVTQEISMPEPAPVEQPAAAPPVPAAAPPEPQAPVQ